MDNKKKIIADYLGEWDFRSTNKIINFKNEIINFKRNRDFHADSISSEHLESFHRSTHVEY